MMPRISPYPTLSFSHCSLEETLVFRMHTKIANRCARRQASPCHGDFQIRHVLQSMDCLFPLILNIHSHVHKHQRSIHQHPLRLLHAYIEVHLNYFPTNPRTNENGNSVWLIRQSLINRSKRLATSGCSFSISPRRSTFTMVHRYLVNSPTDAPAN